MDIILSLARRNITQLLGERKWREKISSSKNNIPEAANTGAAYNPALKEYSHAQITSSTMFLASEAATVNTGL